MTDFQDRKLVNIAAEVAEVEAEGLYNRTDNRFYEFTAKLTRYLLDHREDWYPIQEDDTRVLKTIQDFYQD